MPKQVVTTEYGSYIDGVPPIGFGQWTDCTYSGCLALFMDAAGIDATYEQIMGLTGSCYRASMAYGWDPGSNIVDISYSYLGIKSGNNADRAFGFGEYTVDDETERNRQIRGSIDAGIPVLVLDGRGAPEWGIVLGYETVGGETKYFGRSYFDGNAAEDELFTENRYALFNNFNGKSSDWYKLYKPAEPISETDALRISLTACVEMFKPHGKFGYGAYYQMIEGLENSRYPTEWGSDGDVGTIFYTLLDARRAAYIYLDESAGLLNGDMKSDLAAVSVLYKDMFDLLQNVIPYEEDIGGLLSDEQKRTELIAVLHECVEYERQAQETIKNILERMEGEYL